MSLEQAVAANTEALNKQNELLAKLLERGGVTGAASTTTVAASTAATNTAKANTAKANTAKDTKPKGPSVEEMQAALTEVKEKFSAAEAKAIIKDSGGASKMAEIPADKVKAVFDACQAMLNPPADGGDGDEGDGL